MYDLFIGNNRLTLLIYLNPDWKNELGGALRLTPANSVTTAPDGGVPPPTTGTGGSEEKETVDQTTSNNTNNSTNSNDKSKINQPSSPPQAVDVYPMCGRMALFQSANIPHEVMPTWGDRY